MTFVETGNFFCSFSSNIYKKGVVIRMEKKWDSSYIEEQTERVAIVTGASSGIGFETARVLAEKNATVIIATRNSQKGERAVETIRNRHKNTDVHFMLLDLADLKSVKEFVSNFRQHYQRLDLLINNAGVMMPPYAKTKDGYELQFGTNHLGHFVLTALLFYLLSETAHSRIVTVSSNMHKRGAIDLEDLNWENRKYNKMQAYSDSKIANLYFTYELGRRAAKNSQSPLVVASHPGWTATELQRYTAASAFFNKIFAQNIQMGALPTLYAAVGPEVQTGDYFGPSGFMQMKGFPQKTDSCARAKDEEIAAKLWDISEVLTGIRFDPSRKLIDDDEKME
jgi:NAD(P)-dependent dehydrogenase (short-subunit alcohol dehydrogenase family)